MNVVTDMPGKLIKCRHTGIYYKYLVQLNEIWAILVYDNTDENQVYEEICLSYRDAIYRYNHLNEGDFRL